MEFGPEIKVDGVRPEWLEDDDAMEYRHSMDRPEDGMIPVTRHGGWSAGDWKCVTAIRLSATHSCYQTTPTRTPLEDRMVAHMLDSWRSMAKVDPKDVGPHFAANWIETAKSILAEAENPDITEARILVESMNNASDEDIALAALARGRQLEKEGK